MTQVTIPTNILIFFGTPIAYDIILRGRSPAVWGLHSHNYRMSALLGILTSVATFPLVYITFKVIFNFNAQEFVQPGTVAYYFYTEFAYPFNMIYYVAWTFLVIAFGEELFFRGFIHKKLGETDVYESRTN